MPIELTCSGCARRLRVPKEHAGMQARCPNCRTVFTVPDSSEDSVIEAETVEETGSGWAFGGEPSSFDQGGVSGRREREPSFDWQPGSGNRGHSGASAASQNPFASPAPSRGVSRSRPRPHRGGLILALGILSWVVCPIFGLMAWMMGNDDLARMKAGRMDTSGYDLTRTGSILGMVHVLVIGGVMALVFLIMLLATTLTV